jgi:thiamine biosynthesis lipoprotein
MTHEDSDRARFDVDEHVFADSARHFAHSAMATVFEIYCAHPDAEYAGQAAQAAFELVDRLEQELSRFIENSDISRINCLEPGQCAGVSPQTLECLQMARRMYIETGKAFDISIGSGLDTLELGTGDMTVRVSSRGVRLDLGGIGKGYAVDRMAELLEEWEIPRALLHGGFSSVLALEPPPNANGWPLTLSLPGRGNNEVLARICARQQAFSASGVQKGNHIVDPRDMQPVHGRLAAWVSLPRSAAPSSEAAGVAECHPTGDSASAIAEAFSTAFMILTIPEVKACCERWSGLEAWLILQNAENESRLPIFLHFPTP